MDNPFQAIQNQAQQAGASAAQGAIAQAQGALPSLAQQVAQQGIQQLQAAQGVVQQAGAAAGAGAREGLLGDLSTGTVALIGVGAVALLGIVGFAAYRAGKKDEGVNWLNSLNAPRQPAQTIAFQRGVADYMSGKGVTVSAVGEVSYTPPYLETTLAQQAAEGFAWAQTNAELESD